jgi:hypothetical protein
MNSIQFYNAYQPVEIRAMQFDVNYRGMTVPKRAEEAVEIQQSMNKVFADKVKDEMLGHHIDTLA